MRQRTKNNILIAGFLVLLILAYRLTFSKTFDVESEISQLESEKVAFQQKTQQATSLMQRERHADSILKKFSIKNRSVQNHLLDFLNEAAAEGGVGIAEFVEPHLINEQGVTINSYPFTLKGSYQGIERVLYQMEQQYNFGKVSHVSFDRKTNFRKRKQELECFIIVEHLEVQE